MPFRFFASLALVSLATSPAVADVATSLAPHQAIYDLSLTANSSEFVGAEGRIAMELKTETCGVYKLDYRFVAKFEQEQEITLTDQQTLSTESVSGTEFHFSTKTFVDGSPEKEIRGKAEHDGAATRVSMEEPEAKSFALPLSRFPMQHTLDLIAKAKAGVNIIEARLFDGDDDAQKLLTSTSIIAPNVPDGHRSEGAERSTSVNGQDAADPATSARIDEALVGLQSWKISELYYNSDSDPDGLPVFQTSYVLYENGVSDDLKLDFGTYAFAGSLSKLDLFDTPTCK